MVALDPRLSGKLDRVIGIARPTVADPEGDGILYSVRRTGELVKKWQIFGHEAEGSSIRLRLDLGLNAEFSPVEGTLPAGTDLFFETEDGSEERYTIVRFHPGADAFDYCPEIAPDGQSATFHYSDDLEYVPGVNQKAAGAAFVVAELDRHFVWPSPVLRSIILTAGYSTARNGGLFVEEARQVWARMEDNRITPDGRSTEWTVADAEIAAGDIIVYGGQRLTVQEVEGIDRSPVKRVVATLVS